MFGKKFIKTTLPDEEQGIELHEVAERLNDPTTKVVFDPSAFEILEASRHTLINRDKITSPEELLANELGEPGKRGGESGQDWQVSVLRERGK